MNIPEDIKTITGRIKEFGGRAWIVGGASIDLLSNKEPKDWDIEVFNMSIEDIEDAVDCFGDKDLIGLKFGIVKLKTDIFNRVYDIEFSIPRRDNKIGAKHKDFLAIFDPSMTIKEAARRRDFTINTIYIDPLTEEVVDPFNGLRDLKEGVLDYVDEETFLDDPLRVYRGIQIVARKARRWSDRLIDAAVYSDTPSCLGTVSNDAIFGELTKLLMLADKPSIGLDHLEWIMGAFPELEALLGCPQSKLWHPEGTVYEHLKLVMDEAAKWRHEIPEDWRLAFMFGMLLHDIGKPLCLNTSNDKLTTIGHDTAGVEPARNFMSRFTNNQDLINKVCSIVECHMRPKYMTKSSLNKASWRRLQNICPLNIVAYVTMCDNDGRGCPELPLGKTDPSFIQTMHAFEHLGKPTGKIKPVLQGRHLIEAGHKPSKEFGAMLKKAYEYQIETGCKNIEELLNVTKI